jgi:hypothetical protein
MLIKKWAIAEKQGPCAPPPPAVAMDQHRKRNIGRSTIFSHRVKISAKVAAVSPGIASIQ